MVGVSQKRGNIEMFFRNTTSFVWLRKSQIVETSYYLCEVSTIRDLDTSGEKLHQDLLGRGLKRYLFFWYCYPTKPRLFREPVAEKGIEASLTNEKRPEPSLGDRPQQSFDNEVG